MVIEHVKVLMYVSFLGLRLMSPCTNSAVTLIMYWGLRLSNKMIWSFHLCHAYLVFGY